MGKLRWDSPVRTDLVLAGSGTERGKSGSAQRPPGPVSALGLAGAISGGSRSEGEEDVLEGDEGAEGKEVGAVLVPGGVRSSRAVGSR